MIPKNSSFPFVLIVCLLMVPGCADGLPPTRLPWTPAAKPTIAPVSAPTLPAISPEDLIATNGDCTLPCFWGIQPGGTSWDEALRLFRQMGAQGTSGVFNKIEYYQTQVDFENLSIQFKLYRKEDLVEAMMVTISNNPPATGLPAELKSYSLKKTFTDLGVPSRLVLQLVYPPEGPSDLASYAFWVMYATSGVQEQYLGELQESSPSALCPEQPFNSLVLYLYSPELEFLPWGSVMLTDSGNVDTVGEVPPAAFYHAVTESDKPACVTEFPK